MRKLISRADHERVKRIARIQLRRAIPVETRLRGRRRRRRSLRRKPAVMPHLGCRRIVFGGHELHVVKSQAQIVDRFLNQVGVLVTMNAILNRWYPHEQHSATGVTVACRLEPGVVGMPVDLFFQRIQNSRPRIRGKACARN